MYSSSQIERSLANYYQWGPDDQQYAVAFVVFSSVGGSIFGPVIGGFLQQYTALYWNFWAQLIMGAIVQAIHFFYVPETRTSCLVTAEAKRRRSEGETNVYSEGEINHRPFLSKEGMKHCIKIWIRPFKMFIFEPIVLWLSLISGFSDALIFTFLDSTGLVYGLWEFTPSQIGLVFLAIGFGYILAYGIWARVIRRQNKIRKTKNSKKLEPEARLTWLLWTAPLLVVGIFCFAGTSTGPPLPWIASVLFLILIGIANYAIYGATIDYMVAAYGAYSASATGGNGFARDFLAGIAAIYAHPLYTRFGDTVPEQLRNGSFLLGGIGLILLIPIYVFWWYGPKIREKSKFATKLDNERKQKEQSLPLTSKEGSSGIDRGQGVLE
jgi:MFS family permease